MKPKKVLIIGTHPIGCDMTRQFAEMGCHVEHCADVEAASALVGECDEVCVLSQGTGIESCRSTADSRAIAGLDVLASHIPDGRKVVCHLLLHSNTTLWLLRSNELKAEVANKLDVYPFTIDDVWSRNVVLDRQPINVGDNRVVHLVIVGSGTMAECVAVNAALTAHYPNYTRNHRLRTRITVVDEHASRLCQVWAERYKHLADNSYYRVVKPTAAQVVTEFHKPKYAATREDFVDVEWEWVEASVYDSMVREKFQLWSKNTSGQLLTIVMAHASGDRNLSEALYLPDAVSAMNVPVYVTMRHSALLENVAPHDKLKNLIPIGMVDHGYDMSLPLVDMAKTINYIYDYCYNENILNWTGEMNFAVEVEFAKREQLWRKLTLVKRMSSIYNAMTVESKMRALGITRDDWHKFYDLSQQDIELMAQVEHNRWNVVSLILGYRPCSDAEQREVEADIAKKEELKQAGVHYDLRAYNDLRPDATGKPVQVYDLCLCACLPLIAKTAVSDDLKGGDQ